MRMWRGAPAAVLVLFGFLWSLPPSSAAGLYVVRPHDTVYRISRRFGTTPAALAALNQLAPDWVIRPGRRLVIPDVPSALSRLVPSLRPAGPARPARPELSTTLPADADAEAAAATPDVERARMGALGRRFLDVAPGRTSLPSRSSLFGLAVVRAALALIGRPYHWSGTGQPGFDCSGLVAHVFAALGVPLPHSSYGQFAAGTAVLRAELFAGDLVFFQTDGRGPSHVGIYVGDSRFVHASSSRGVALASVDDPYFSPRFVGARRL